MAETIVINFVQDKNIDYTVVKSHINNPIPDYTYSNGIEMLPVKKIGYVDTIIEEDSEIGAPWRNSEILWILPIKFTDTEIYFLTAIKKPLTDTSINFLFFNKAVLINGDTWYHEYSLPVSHSFLLEKITGSINVDQDRCVYIRCNDINAGVILKHLTDNSVPENPDEVSITPYNLVLPVLTKLDIDNYLLTYVLDGGINYKLITIQEVEGKKKIVVSKQRRLVKEDPKDYHISFTTDGVLVMTIRTEKNIILYFFHNPANQLSNKAMFIYKEIINTTNYGLDNQITVQLGNISDTFYLLEIPETGDRILRLYSFENITSKSNRVINYSFFTSWKDFDNATIISINDDKSRGFLFQEGGNVFIHEMVNKDTGESVPIVYDGYESIPPENFDTFASMELEVFHKLLNEDRDLEIIEGSVKEDKIIYWDTSVNRIYIKEIVSNYAVFIGAIKSKISSDYFYNNVFFTIDTLLPAFDVTSFKVNGYFDTSLAYFAVFKFDDDWLTYDADLLYSSEYLLTLPYGEIKQLAIDLDIPITGIETGAELIALIIDLDIRKGWKLLDVGKPEDWLPMIVPSEKILEFEVEVLPMKAFSEDLALIEGTRKDFAMRFLIMPIIGEPESLDLPVILFGNLEMNIESI